jgi:hypothetical protein
MMATEGWNEQNNSPDLADKLARLRQPDAYPERPESIEVLETHMSWLFLTKRHVYKMKKPVFNHYVDFRTVRARRHHCGGGGSPPVSGDMTSTLSLSCSSEAK